MQRTEELIAEVAESYPHVTVVSRRHPRAEGMDNLVEDLGTQMNTINIIISINHINHE